MLDNYCLVIDDMHPDLRGRLEAIGLSMTYRPGIDKDELLRLLPQYTILICRTRIYIGVDIFRQCPGLRLIVRAGAGLDDIDLEAASQQQITVLNAPEGNRDSVAEHTVGLLLALLNKIPSANNRTKDFFWEREQHRGNEILGKTVSLLGYGNMGQATAQRLAGFGCRLLAFDKYKDQWPTYGAQQATLDEVYDQTDILLIHLPLTPETKGMCDLTFWKRFRKPIWVLNTGRGPIINQGELLLALEAGLVLGAALDVLENEKFESLSPTQRDEIYQLAQRQNVILTPHVAGWTHESYRRLNEIVVLRIANWQKTHPNIAFNEVR